MLQLLDWFRSHRPATAVKPPQGRRLTVEALEHREVLSTASASMHAVTDAYGNSALFYINPQNGALYEKDAYHGTRQLSSPGYVVKFTAGLDAQGYANVWALGTDGDLWEFNNGNGWELIFDDAQIGDFAAVKGERLYLEALDGSLWQYDGTAWLWGLAQLSGPDSVANSEGSIDAVTDNFGRDSVFAVRWDGTFQRFDVSGNYWQYLSGAHTIQYGFSAGVGYSGNADVYGVAGDGSFWKWDNGWTYLAGAGVVYKFSATTGGQCWFIAMDGTLDKFNMNNTRKDVNDSYYNEISAAADNDVFVHNVWNDKIWERKAENQWVQVT